MTLKELDIKVKTKIKDTSKDDKKKLLKPVYQELSSGNPVSNDVSQSESN